MAKGFLGSKDAIVGVAAAAAIIFIGWKAGDGLGEAIGDVGEGYGNMFSGVGFGVGSLGSGVGLGVQGLGQGVGYGVGQLGEGVGYGVGQLGEGVGYGVGNVGAGIYEVGKGIRDIGGGAGYAISGANPQDLLQTVLPWGKEASTYSQNNNNQISNIGYTGDVMPTSSSTQGIQTFSPIGNVFSWVAKQSSLKSPVTNLVVGGAKSIFSKVSGAITGSATSGSIKEPVVSSSSGSSSSSSSSSTPFIPSGTIFGGTGSGNLIPTQTLLQSVPDSSLKSTKTWYKPWSWF